MMNRKIISAICIATYCIQFLTVSVSADTSVIPNEIEKRIESSFDRIDNDLVGKSEIQKIKRYNFIIIKLQILQKKKKNLNSTDHEILELVKNTANSRVKVLKTDYKSLAKKTQSIIEKNDIISEENKDIQSDIVSENIDTQSQETSQENNEVTKDNGDNLDLTPIKNENLNLQLYPEYKGGTSVPTDVRLKWNISSALKEILNNNEGISTELLLIDANNLSSTTTLSGSLSNEILESNIVEIEIPEKDNTGKEQEASTYFVEMKMYYEKDGKEIIVHSGKSFKTFLNINGKSYSSGGSSSGGSSSSSSSSGSSGGGSSSSSSGSSGGGSSSGGNAIVSGEIATLAYDVANVDNEFNKQILAGDSVVIGSFDVRSNNEAINVGGVEIGLDYMYGNLESTAQSFHLLLNGEVVSRNGDLDDNILYFTDITQLQIGEITGELAVLLNTSESTPLSSNISMNSITLNHLEGAETGLSIDSITTNNFQSTTTSIIHAIVTPSIINTFNVDDNSATIRINTQHGDPLCELLGICKDVTLDSIILHVNSLVGSGSIRAFNTDGTNITIGGSVPVTSGTIAIPIAGESNLSEIRIQTNAEANYSLARNGIAYSVNSVEYSTILESSIDLGQYIIQTPIIPGEIATLAYDVANVDNEFNKQILVGDSVVLGSFDLRANNESVDIESIEVGIEIESGNLENIAQSFNLIVNGEFISSSGVLDNNVVYFGDITQLEIGEFTSELAIQLNTSESGGLANNISISSISLDEMEGVETGRSIDRITTSGFQSSTSSIVPAIVAPLVIDTFNVDDNNATIRIISEQGDPLCALLGICQNIVLDAITLEVSSLIGTGSISVFNSEGTNITAGGSVPMSSGILEIPIINTDIDGSEIRIVTNTQALYSLNTQGIKYSISGNSYSTLLENRLNLGQYIIETPLAGVGEIATLTYDVANEDNEFNKQVLPGDSIVIGSFDVRARNENVNVGEIEVGFSVPTSGNLSNIAESMSILINGELVDGTSVVNSNSITISNISNLDIDTTTGELAIQLNTSSGSNYVNDISIASLSLDSMTGVDTFETINRSQITNISSKNTSIVPAIVVPYVINTLGTDDKNILIGLSVDSVEGGSAILKKIKLVVTSVRGVGDLRIFDTRPENITVGENIAVTLGTLDIPITDQEINGSLYRIETDVEGSYRFSRDAIEYTVNGVTYTSLTENALDLGQYSSSN